MNGTANKAGFRGMVLIEAMVALVVLAIGILGVAKLSSYFIEVSGQSKARAQAVQLAESKLAELRSLMVKDPQFDDDIANGSEPVYGFSGDEVRSTQFTRSWTVKLNGTESKEIEVTVSWTDRFGEAQAVAVNSVVAWNSPGAAAGLQAMDESGGPGKYAKAPRGNSEPGKGKMPIPAGAISQDGLYEIQGDDGKYYLLGEGGNVLLVSPKPFSRVSGRLYLHQSLSGIAYDDVVVDGSDGVECGWTPPKNAEPANTWVNFDTGVPYKYFSYTCKMAEGWHGNIGVVREDNANTNDRVCVGDPGVAPLSASVKSDNRHPALSTARMYRGYKASGADFQSTGIGINSSGNYTPATYDGHDFLLVRITGNPTDADCGGKLDDYDATAPHQPFGTCASPGGCSGEIYDAQTHTNTEALPATETAFLNGESQVKLGNPGKFFCLTQTCPDPLPDQPASQLTIQVSGTISLIGTGANPDITMTTSSGSCESISPTESSASYSCSFTGEGFTGGSWSGTMSVAVSGGWWICPGTSPRPTSAAVQNSWEFVFTNQSTDNTTVTLDFSVADSSSCSTGGGGGGSGGGGGGGGGPKK